MKNKRNSSKFLQFNGFFGHYRLADDLEFRYRFSYIHHLEDNLNRKNMSDSFFNGNQWKKRLKQRFGLRVMMLKTLDDGYSEGKAYTAYEIQSIIHKMTFSIWKPSPGSIYPVLEDLVNNELASVEKRDKDYYKLTSKGHDVFQQILSFKLLTDIAMTNLYRTFDHRMIVLPTEFPHLTQHMQHIASMIGNFAEQEGICKDAIREHISGIEMEIRKEKMNEIIEGIENYIQILQHVKKQIQKQQQSNQ
ncbi:MAG: PadR family transcriptional regulator [Candidatus Hodarchaeales archaeon]